MKKSLFLLALVGFLATQVHADPAKSRKVKAPKASMEKQLANYISTPDVLKQNQLGGIVVIQFRVNAESEVCQLTVFSKNEQINNSLTRQLAGRKLTGYGSDAGELHTVRLRFQPE